MLVYLLVCCLLQIFIKYFFKKIFSSVKPYAPRSGPTFCWALSKFELIRLTLEKLRGHIGFIMSIRECVLASDKEF